MELISFIGGIFVGALIMLGILLVASSLYYKKNPENDTEELRSRAIYYENLFNEMRKECTALRE